MGDTAVAVLGSVKGPGFSLKPEFVEKYRSLEPPFGFNGLGKLVFLRTYSRLKEDGTNESWTDTVERVVNGTYSMQKRWIEANGLFWSDRKAHASAEEMFDRIWNMKFLPPGRGLWAMGSPLTEEKGLWAALNNCGFVSTENLAEDLADPFTYLMDASMLGIGVGFDTKGAGQLEIQQQVEDVTTYVIPDTREGWVESVGRLLESYFVPGQKVVTFDYRDIRPAGAPIRGFGGVASGPAPLRELHERIREQFDGRAGEKVTSRDIVDIMNFIGACVVAGNVRRTAEIAFGDPNDEEYIGLKDYHWDGEKYVGPEAERAQWGWTSNNSVFAELGMDYSEIADRIATNGEPGLAWLDNMREFGRMGDPRDYRDRRAAGGNPCFTGDTLIAVADGRGAVPLAQLADEGADVPVYSVNEEGRVEIKWARNPRKTRENAELVRVTLDDDTKVTVTPDHKFRLLDGSWKHAQDLEAGDSLPRFTKRAERMSSDNPNRYLRVNTDTLDSSHERVMEHRLIAKFHYPEEFEELYDESKENGWIRGGVVVHHEDYNGLNNRPDNLTLMLFKDHALLHSHHDRAGENNGMFGREHTSETKALIGEGTKRRWGSPEIRKKMLSGICAPKNREIYANNMREVVEADLRQFYLDAEANTDLETVWRGNRLYALKDCISCGEKMTLPWGKRHGVYCGHVCKNKHDVQIEKRRAGQMARFEDRSRDNLHAQIMVFKDLQDSLGRDPRKTEWESACREEGTPFRVNPYSENPNIPKSYGDLKDRAAAYNHRVKKVEVLDHTDDVYNLTVDDNFTVGVVTRLDETTGSASGIFVFQCLEQTLESYELCCLVESFPAKHDSLEDYKRTLKFAYLYAKTVTLGRTPWPRTNDVLLRNRRIGTSQSGIVQTIAKLGMEEYRQWCEEGYETVAYYDEVYSDWLKIPRSIKLTSVKPSGTTSLLVGATPGMHFPEFRTYIRRMRLSVHSDLVEPLKQAGYKVEPAIGQEETTVVVEIPVRLDEEIRTVDEVSMWEQLSLAAFLQKYWSDNQVSCTVTFKPGLSFEESYELAGLADRVQKRLGEIDGPTTADLARMHELIRKHASGEADQIARALDFFQYQLKGISFLPKTEMGAYAQMPYEAISDERYEEMAAELSPLVFEDTTEEAEAEKFCSNDTCVIEL